MCSKKIVQHEKNPALCATIKDGDGDGDGVGVSMSEDSGEQVPISNILSSTELMNIIDVISSIYLVLETGIKIEPPRLYFPGKQQSKTNNCRCYIPHTGIWT